MNVCDLLKGKEICVCAGSGGVGKTTVAAAIAMGMAAEGKKVAVITIDPAKRLANALGLEELGNEAKLIDAERFTRQGLEMKGELWAMMLDPKRTWDELVVRNAPDQQSREKILNNRIYQELSNAIAGSQEYSAMEKLYELYQEDGYDLLVLDTPPSRNALDFLDAPDRITHFLEGRSLQFFLRPGMRVFGRGGAMLFSILKRLTGIDLLKDLSDFFQSIGDLTEGFRDRARAVKTLLSDKRTTFMLVSAPEREPIDESIFFFQRMRQAKLPFGAAIINKVHHDYLQHAEDADDRPLQEILENVQQSLAALFESEGSDGRLAAKVYENFHDYQVLAERDRGNITRLVKRLDEERVIRVPYLDDDVYDIDGLMQINRYLFSTRAEREEIIETVSV